METVAVIFGGKSTEHDVSIITALASVIKPLELGKKYRVEAVYITKDGAWHWGDQFKDIALYSSGNIDAVLAKDTPAAVRFDGGMTLTKGSGLGRKSSQKIDIVFPAMHGTFGEDGALMGLLEMAGVPYVGCGVAASVVAMDKVLSKLMAEAHGIPVTKFQYFPRSFIQKDLDTVTKKCLERLSLPLFIKPAHLGSSIGISMAKDEAALRNGLEVAAHYDDKVLVEEAVQNLIEVTLPVMGNGNPEPALLERPLTHAEDFFDFETKYMHGGKKGKGGGKQGAQGYSELPAQLSKDLYDKAEAIGLEVYRVLGCSGMARVDMLIDSKANHVYFNEVNPLPGSLYAHNWRAKGISNVELVEKFISLAKEQFADRAHTTTTFATSYLKQF